MEQEQEQDFITPEQFELIKSQLQESLKGALQELQESPSYSAVQVYTRVLDQLNAWVSYKERRAQAKDVEEIETTVRRAWYADAKATSKVFLSVLSDKERRRERWCHYAAAALSDENNTPALAADNADTMLVEEEKRFGKTMEDPERSCE